MELNSPLNSNDIKFIDDISSDGSIDSRPIQRIDRLYIAEPCCSSDDTVFLNLPELCGTRTLATINQLSTAQATDNGLEECDANDDTNGMSTPIQSISDNTSASSTPITNRTKCTDDRTHTFSDWSSDDEDTSGYNDKYAVLSSTYSSEQHRLQSDYFNSSRGAYYSNNFSTLRALLFNKFETIHTGANVYPHNKSNLYTYQKPFDVFYYIKPTQNPSFHWFYWQSMRSHNFTRTAQFVQLNKLFNLPDESTCCDDDFTWVCNNTKEKNTDADRAMANNYTPLKSSTNNDSSAKQIGNGQPMDASSKSTNKTASKTSTSLDRRRVQSRNRHERDTKSRSVHSLQDSSATSTTDYAMPNSTMKGDAKSIKPPMLAIYMLISFLFFQ